MFNIVQSICNFRLKQLLISDLMLAKPLSAIGTTIHLQFSVETATELHRWGAGA